MQDEPIDPPTDALIGIVHPLEMTVEMYSGFAQLFADYEIMPPLRQPSYRTVLLTPDESTSSSLTRWESGSATVGQLMGVRYKDWGLGYESAFAYNLGERRLVLRFLFGFNHYNIGSKAPMSFRSLRVYRGNKFVTSAELDVFDSSETLSAPDVTFRQSTVGSDATTRYQYDLPVGEAIVVQKELTTIYDYEVPVPEDPFFFRLEVHKCSELFIGPVYRLERSRLRPTLHQHDREDADPLIDDALIYIRDECINEWKL